MIDAAGYSVAPGLVDLHVHGGNNADFMDGTLEPIGKSEIGADHGRPSLIPIGDQIEEQLAANPIERDKSPSGNSGRLLDTENFL